MTILRSKIKQIVAFPGGADACDLLVALTEDGELFEAVREGIWDGWQQILGDETKPEESE